MDSASAFCLLGLVSRAYWSRNRSIDRTPISTKISEIHGLDSWGLAMSSRSQVSRFSQAGTNRRSQLGHAWSSPELSRRKDTWCSL
jgi:hypothetical protein